MFVGIYCILQSDVRNLFEMPETLNLGSLSLGSISLLGLGSLSRVVAGVIIILIMRMTFKKIFHSKPDPLAVQGDLGERSLRQCLENLPEPKRILYHVYLPAGENQTTEVDLILIHETGIYVFESKNYSGYIKGKARNPKWVQISEHSASQSSADTWKASKGRKCRRRTFYNPIMQNEGHIRALRKVLRKYTGFHDFYSIIVFGDSCRLGRIRIKNPHTFVVNRRFVTKLCYRLMRRGTLLYSENQIDEIASVLAEYVNVNRKIQRKHVRDIRRRYGDSIT